MGRVPVTNSIVLGVARVERRKGWRRGRPGGFIGSQCLAEGVRVRAQGEIRRRAGEGLCPRVGDDPDEWAHMSAGEDEGEGPIRCGVEMGCGLLLKPGRKVSPSCFPSFLFLSFSFSVFSFLLKLLQNSFKSTQTTSENSLEIHTTFLTQNNQVFKMKIRFLNKTF
jgi:hypothetical protein